MLNDSRYQQKKILRGSILIKINDIITNACSNEEKRSGLSGQKRYTTTQKEKSQSVN